MRAHMGDFGFLIGDGDFLADTKAAPAKLLSKQNSVAAYELVSTILCC